MITKMLTDHDEYNANWSWLPQCCVQQSHSNLPCPVPNPPLGTGYLEIVDHIGQYQTLCPGSDLCWVNDRWRWVLSQSQSVEAS